MCRFLIYSVLLIEIWKLLIIIFLHYDLSNVTYFFFIPFIFYPLLFLFLCMSTLIDAWLMCFGVIYIFFIIYYYFIPLHVNMNRWHAFFSLSFFFFFFFFFFFIIILFYRLLFYCVSTWIDDMHFLPYHFLYFCFYYYYIILSFIILLRVNMNRWHVFSSLSFYLFFLYFIILFYHLIK